ncbi:MAG TPA: S1/P1 nuclease [Vicinamibacterales bacterium]|nr:S1/P1 nuclease [Vicinamibacterales bacterium]
MPTPTLRATAAGLGLIALLAVDAGAFGETGHRIIGTLAELHLRDSRALGEVRRILRPGESLADAAYWPDAIKNPLYLDEDSEIFRLNHPGHDTYHYANLPFQASAYALDVPGARPTDAVQIARESIRVLRTGKGMFTPREALRMLAHLAGDIHQPLHVGNAFVSAAGPLEFVVPKGPTGWRTTLGGNALVYGAENRFNLHSYWDSHAVNLARGGDDAPTYAARLMKEFEPTAAWRGRGAAEEWPAQWATEGLAHAKEAYRGLTLVAYLGPDDAKRTAHRWQIEQPAGYDDRARPLVRQQMAMAGYRLAAVLRAIWPD